MTTYVRLHIRTHKIGSYSVIKLSKSQYINFICDITIGNISGPDNNRNRSVCKRGYRYGIKGGSWQRPLIGMLSTVRRTYFNTICLELLDTHVPLKSFKQKFASSSTWFNSEIKRAILERNLSRLRSRSTADPADLQHYRCFRNLVITLIRNSKSQYFKPPFKLPRTVWVGVWGGGERGEWQTLFHTQFGAN